MSGSLGYAFANTVVGELIVIADETGIRMVEWGGDEGALLEHAIERFAGSDLRPGEHGAESLATGVAAIVEDARTADADLPLSLRGTAFQHQVWDSLRSIPAGETRTYAEVAARIGRPTAYRAVAQACARNPVPIVVPCHRVIASDGSLHGFSGGLWRKRILLEREGVEVKG